MGKCIGFVYVEPTNDYYTVNMREGSFLYVFYGINRMGWWHDISRAMIGK